MSTDNGVHILRFGSPANESGPTIFSLGTSSSHLIHTVINHRRSKAHGGNVLKTNLYVFGFAFCNPTFQES
jgi:hypothetical protein